MSTCFIGYEIFFKKNVHCFPPYVKIIFCFGQALTVSQMASLSTAQALSVTDDQLSVLNPAQKAQLRALGATISDPSGAPG